jgi:glycerol uptake facilitator-like aquaporin
MTPYVVEFLGTLLFIGAVSFSGNPAIILAALAFAMGMGSKISGGHFNPAVSTWAWFDGKLTSVDYTMYLLAQFGAAVLVWVMGQLL